MPYFDYTISLWNVLSFLAFFLACWWAATKAFVAFDRRIGKFEDVLLNHAHTLTTHSNRMEKQDDLLFKLVGDVQRLVGSMEMREGRQRHGDAA
ncbi:MAG: hypothetical protein Q7R41_17065 [Phycisphaerales bacterium]|nr:hypothetical protein [Phycisphaerales bacterium]